jgi:small GTP-binding protein
MENFIEIKADIDKNISNSPGNKLKVKLIDSDDEYDKIDLKLLVLGDPCVGKTSIIKRFTSNSFEKEYYPTKSCEFNSKAITLNKKSIILKIWDIGNENKKMLDTYLYKCNGILLVYDISNEESFKNLSEWMHYIKEYYIKKNSNIPHMSLITNKLDLFHIQGTTQEAKDLFIKENKLKPFMLSAKTGDQIDYVFIKIVCEIMNIELTNDEMNMNKPIIKAVLNKEGGKQDPKKIESKPDLNLVDLNINQEKENDKTKKGSKKDEKRDKKDIKKDDKKDDKKETKKEEKKEDKKNSKKESTVKETKKEEEKKEEGIKDSKKSKACFIY